MLSQVVDDSLLQLVVEPNADGGADVPQHIDSQEARDDPRQDRDLAGGDHIVDHNPNELGRHQLKGGGQKGEEERRDGKGSVRPEVRDDSKKRLHNEVRSGAR